MITRYRNAALVVGGLLLAVWLAPLGRAQEINPSVRIDGAPVKMDVPAILDVAAGRTLVPVRYVAEPLGYTVTWESGNQTIFAERNGRTIEFRIGSRAARVNGLPAQLSVAPRLIKGRTMVPLRFFAEFAGATVKWDEATGSVDILSPTSRLDRPDAGWALPQAGIRRTGFNDASAFGAAAVPMWEAGQLLDPYNGAASATAGEGMVFVAGGDRILALNRETGDVAWEAALPVSMTPVYDAARGQVYAVAGSYGTSKLYALEAATGRMNWFAAVGGGRQPQPLLIGSQVIINAGDDSTRGMLIAFDANTGSKRWQASVQGSGVPAAYGARLFLADDYGGVFAYRTWDGSPLWSRPGNRREREYGQYELVVDSGHVYFAMGTKVMALNEATGKLAWERNDLNMAAGMASDGVKLWLAVRDGVNVLDAATGDRLRYPAVCSSWPSAPVISRSHAFVACDGMVYSIDRQSYAVSPLTAGKGPLALDLDRLYYMKGDFGGYRHLSSLMALPDSNR